MLANAGLTYDDVIKVPAPNVAASARDFASGKSDVLFFALGSGKVMEVAAKVGGLRVLPVDASPEAVARLHKVNPDVYVTVANPAPNVVGITKPTNVCAIDVVLFTNAGVPDEVIYKIMKGIYENKADLENSFKPFGLFDVKRMATPIEGVPFHPGAIKFYKEIGLLPAK